MFDCDWYCNHVCKQIMISCILSLIFVHSLDIFVIMFNVCILITSVFCVFIRIDKESSSFRRTVILGQIMILRKCILKKMMFENS